MNLHRSSRLLALAAVILAILAYCIADRYPLLFVGAGTLAVAGWWLTEGRGVRPLPKLVINLAVTAAIVWSFYRVAVERAGEGLTVSAFCQFLILVLLAKMWDQKQARDVAQVVTLSIFLTVGAVLTANSLGVGLVMLLNAAVVLFATMLLHLASGVERAESGPAAQNSKPLPSRSARSLAVCGTLSLIFGMIVSVGVWIVMPRGIGEGDLGALGQWARARRTGLTDRVDLRRTGLISESSRAVLDLRLENAQGQVVGSENRRIYLRAWVLDQYSRGAWTSNNVTGPDINMDPGRPWPTADIADRNALVQKITYRDAPSTGAAMPCVLDPVSVTLDSVGKVSRAPQTHVLQRTGHPGRFEYTIVSVARRTPDDRSEIVRKSAASFGSPKIAQLVRTILADKELDPDPAARPPALDADVCRAFEDYLRTNFTYTLNPDPTRDGDPIEGFLFTTRNGHCEYFASAMAAMLRSVGIPSRVIAGFVATEYSPDAETYTVRESNAHAWVEALVGAGVWATFDPTPPQELARQARPSNSFTAHWRQWMDSMDELWASSVVTFDETSRRKLFGGVDTNPVPWLQEQLSRIHLGFQTGKRVGLAPLLPSLAVLVTGAVIALAATWFLARIILKHWRLRAARLFGAAGGRIDDAVLAAHASFYPDVLRAIAKHGAAKPAWRPPLDHADGSAMTPSLSRPFHEAVRLYYLVRFGRTPLSPEQRDRATQLLSELRNAPR